jgi:hypothetical protein
VDDLQVAVAVDDFLAVEDAMEEDVLLLTFMVQAVQMLVQNRITALTYQTSLDGTVQKNWRRSLMKCAKTFGGRNTNAITNVVYRHYSSPIHGTLRMIRQLRNYQRPVVRMGRISVPGRIVLIVRLRRETTTENVQPDAILVCLQKFEEFRPYMSFHDIGT